VKIAFNRLPLEADILAYPIAQQSATAQTAMKPKRSLLIYKVAVGAGPSCPTGFLETLSRPENIMNQSGLRSPSRSKVAALNHSDHFLVLGTGKQVF